MKKIVISFFCVCCLVGMLVSCAKDEKEELVPLEEISPKLNALSFKATNNVDILIEDISGEIIGDSIVDCWVPHLMPSKELRVDIEANGGSVFLDGQEYMKTSKFDFSHPVILSITNGDVQKQYQVFVHAFTGLPVIWVETDQRSDITSREEYVGAHFKIVEDVLTRAPGDVIECEGQIRGRGNSTWFQPKQPYRIKFDEKIALLGEPKDKKWNLLANHFDRSLIRNALAFYMGSMSELEYTPKWHFVELMLNGRYEGTYQVTEALKIAKHRINIGDDGYLLEIDNHIREYEVGFRTSHLNWPIRIHEPEVVVDDTKYNYIRDYVNKAEEVLYSDDFLNGNKGYEQYIDKKSFAEWYVINEMLQNATAADNGYMTLSIGGRLKMGPLWDFDLSIGNNPWDHIDKIESQSVNPRAFWAKNYHWYPRLFEDPEFVQLVKNRFNYFYSKQEDIMSFINDYALYLKRSANENDSRWNVLYQPLSVDSELMNIWGNYYNEIQYIKNYLQIRFEWLKQEYEIM